MNAAFKARDLTLFKRLSLSNSRPVSIMKQKKALFMEQFCLHVLLSSWRPA